MQRVLEAADDDAADRSQKTATISFGFDETQQRHHKARRLQQAADNSLNVDDGAGAEERPEVPETRRCVAHMELLSRILVFQFLSDFQSWLAAP